MGAVSRSRSSESPVSVSQRSRSTSPVKAVREEQQADMEAKKKSFRTHQGRQDFVKAYEKKRDSSSQSDLFRRKSYTEMLNDARAATQIGEKARVHPFLDKGGVLYGERTRDSKLSGACDNKDGRSQCVRRESFHGVFWQPADPDRSESPTKAVRQLQQEELSEIQNSVRAHQNRQKWLQQQHLI